MFTVELDYTKLSTVLREIVREELHRAKEEKVDKIYSFQEAAEMLRVSTSTLRRRKRNGEIEYHQDGAGPITFLHSDIELYLQTTRKAKRKSTRTPIPA